MEYGNFEMTKEQFEAIRKTVIKTRIAKYIKQYGVTPSSSVIASFEITPQDIARLGRVFFVSNIVENIPAMPDEQREGILISAATIVNMEAGSGTTGQSGWVIVTGSTSGSTSGTTGPQGSVGPQGSTSGSTSGSTTGSTSGSTTGSQGSVGPQGSTSGSTSGSTTGSTSGSTTGSQGSVGPQGSTSGSTTGYTCTQEFVCEFECEVDCVDYYEGSGSTTGSTSGVTGPQGSTGSTSGNSCYQEYDCLSDSIPCEYDCSAECYVYQESGTTGSQGSVGPQGSTSGNTNP